MSGAGICSSCLGVVPALFCVLCLQEELTDIRWPAEEILVGICLSRNYEACKNCLCQQHPAELGCYRTSSESLSGKIVMQGR